MHLIPLFDVADGSSFRQANPHLFGSETSLRWWWRTHRRECVERGAALFHAGRWCAVEPAMSEVVLDIARRNAQRALEVAA